MTDPLIQRLTHACARRIPGRITTTSGVTIDVQRIGSVDALRIIIDRADGSVQNVDLHLIASWLPSGE